MTGDAIATLTDEIVSERGGRKAFSFTQLAIAHQLASALTGPADSATATTVARLTEMLPPVVTEDEGPPWDLTKLTDRQFHLLERLSAICRGEAPPRRIRKPAPKPLTVRGERARELVNLLDGIEADGRKLNDDDLLQVRNHVSDLLGLLCAMTTLAAPYAPQPKPLPTPVLQNATENVAENSAEQPTPAPTPHPDNVVALEGFRYGGPGFGERGAYGDRPRWPK
jgi:hypothetical protein